MRRIAIKLVIILLLGAVVNVAVAWGCAQWGGFVALRDVAFGDDTEPHPTSPQLARVWVLSGGSDEATLYGTEWTGRGLSVYTYFSADVNVFLAGWPLRTMYGYTNDFTNPVLVQGLVSTWGELFGLYGSSRFLPLRPIFPGFLINTLFYATTSWTLLVAPFATRRLIRTRRGRCVKCGYDLRGSAGGRGGRGDPGDGHVCPECGGSRREHRS